MPDSNYSELIPERALAVHTAVVRLALTVVSLFVILLDTYILATPYALPHMCACAAAVTFIAYAGVVLWAIHHGLIRVAAYFPTTAILDVVLAAALVITTNGYLSPFTLWLIIAVVISAAGSQRALPWITAGLGLVAHCLIALVPQERPLNWGIFLVRTGFLFGVAGLLSVISRYQARQSRILASIEEAGRRFGESGTREQVCRTLLEVVMGWLRPAHARVRMSDGETFSAGDDTASGPPIVMVLSAGGRSLGTIHVWRRSALSRGEDSFLRVCCDRAASALLRIDLSESLVRSAAAAERLRVSDNLHDTYVQTLAALDLRTEAVLQRMGKSPDGLGQELREIKELIRVAGRQAREVTEVLCNPLPPGPDAVRAVLSERWLGDSDVEIAPGLQLSDEQWRAVEMFVREGMNNVAKHAKNARKISLHIFHSNGRTECTLHDDGTAPELPTKLGHGLSRLRAVIEEQGGRLALGRAGARGAELRAVFETSK